MKDVLAVVGFYVVFIYTLGLIGWSSIVAQSVSMNGRYVEQCDKTYRFDYIFPAKALGCWLGEQVK